ncbi:hypothetical protein [Streptomyces sp. YIM 98790]|uniref:hypothetical protein n=1 Tax=Streptomyces sp. YIM 98790 TaxID=2689077 RepID=UPI00140D1370|nr:hypothetical protein [Streptomyces sp. YIM 98790]
MRVRVEFRFNSETGEVEVFRVEEVGGSGRGPGADADAKRGTGRDAGRDTAHEDIAHRLGGLLDRRPGVEEAVDPAGPAGGAGGPAPGSAGRSGRVE